MKYLILIICCFCRLIISAGVLPVDVNLNKKYSLNLSGEWKYKLNPLNGEFEGESKIHIPCQFDVVCDNFYTAKVDSVCFTKDMVIPEEWTNKIMKLRFNSIEGNAVIYINNKKTGEQIGLFLPLEYDVTPFINIGEENHITVLVKRSAFTEASGREFLGMCYVPEFYAVEKVFLSDYYESQKFSLDYKKAFLSVNLKMKGMIYTDTIRYKLFDLLGNCIREVSLPNTVSNQVIKIEESFNNVYLWDPEHPNLYTLEVFCNNNLLFTKKIGFREIKIVGKEVFMNGRILKIKGINYHPRALGTEHAISREQLKNDIIFFRDANINFIRPFPVPPMYFHDLCDSLGIMSSVETPVSFVDIEWAPNLKGYGSKIDFKKEYIDFTKRKIAYFKNVPSVIMWSIGNESKFTLPIFEEGGYLTQKLDSTRLVVAEAHESIHFGMGLPQTNMDCLHYPNLNGFGEPSRRPMYYGEWCHLHEYCKSEILIDPGVRDSWDTVVEQHTNYTYHWGVLGGNVFSGNDFFKKSFNGTLERIWGILDLYRRPKPEYFHLKKSNSPIRILSSKIENDSIVFRIANRFLFSNLLETKIICNNRSLHINIDPLKSGDLKLPYKKGQQFFFEFYAPMGYKVDEYLFSVKEGDSLSNFSKERIKTKKNKKEYILVGKEYIWRIDKKTGFLSSEREGKKIIDCGPFLVITPNHSPKMVYATEWKVNAVEYDDAKMEIRVFGKYKEAEGVYKYRILSDGNLELVYEFDWLLPNIITPKGHQSAPDSNDMRELGICFELPVQYDLLEWDRNGYWTNYPDDHIGRKHGFVSAFPNGEKGKSSLAIDKPWSMIQTINGCYDFISTKRNIYKASLTDLKRNGLEIVSNGNQHVHCLYDPSKDKFKMLIMHFYSGGHEKFTHGNGIKRPVKILNKMDYFKDKVLLKLK